uniref:Uncharacterized protein n=1 Tax=Acrobeloides nanus TaxID=290746 RepID=A0A914D4E5_9BILA
MSIFTSFILDGPAIFALYAFLPLMFTPVELAFGWPLTIVAYYLSVVALRYLRPIVSMSFMFTGVAALQALMACIVYKYRHSIFVIKKNNS